uniref:Signal-induced proliferation-associated 1 like 3 n=1 Tax=Xiphophorus couchianus TaxID=32473 RepID=A0A3B5M5P9_9TELE
MNTYRDRGVTCVSSDLLDGGGGLPQNAPLRHTPNGHPTEPAAQPRISVPKMGVRARIAEWPPRRAQSRESLLENGQNGSNHYDDYSVSSSVLSSDGRLVRGGVARLPRRWSKDVEFRGGGFVSDRGSPLSLRVFPPLRQRSNSEVTLSEQDENEVETRGGGGFGNRFRVYGSTSSIDIQGIPEQGFFEMLSQFQQERPDQRSLAPAQLGELLRVPDPSSKTPFPAAPSPAPTGGDDKGTGRKDGTERARKKSGGTESALGTSSLFRKLRSSSRGELDGGKGEANEDRGGRCSTDASYKPWVCPKSFVHFDAQSVLFDLHEAASQRGFSTQRRNTATGASAASSLSGSRLSAPNLNDPIYSSIEDLTLNLDQSSTLPSLPADPLDGPAAHTSSPLLLSCPHFLNEIGGHRERNVSFLSSSAERGDGDGGRGWLRKSNASISVLEIPIEEQEMRLERLKLYGIEHVDQGARYYRDYFHGKDHSNYFGTDDKLGPVAVSIRREKVEDTKDHKDQYQYRIIVRTSEVLVHFPERICNCNPCLQMLTVGCETVDMTLRRNGLGQLGFHVRLDGTVSEVEEYGFAWQAGLRQGSRLVEICKVAAVTLTHEQMIDLLRTSVTVKVVIIPPYEESKPRRGCTEEYEMKTMEQKPEPEPLAVGYRPSLHQTWRWESSPISAGLLNAPNLPRWGPMGPLPPPLARSHKPLIPVPYREPQHFNSKRPVSYPENHYNLSPAGGDRVLPYRNPSASFSSPSTGLVALSPSPDRCVPRPLLPYEPHFSVDFTSSGESSSGFISQESTMERCKTEPLWHVPASSSRGPGGGGGQRRITRQDVPAKDSPNRHSKGEAQYSSHSSSNTLSSNASSSHSDERWFDDPDLLNQGGSNDSGIDASTHYNSSHRGHKTGSQSHKPMHPSATYSGFPELSVGRSNSGESRRQESSPIMPGAANQNKGYPTKTFPPPSSSAEKMDAFKPRYESNCHMGSTALSSSAPKEFYGKSKSRSHQTEETINLLLYFSRLVDTNSKNVFGQPRLRASLRDLRSPRRMYKSTIEDDLKKLIIMDNPGETLVFLQSPRLTLQRTFSDESLCSGRRDAAFACSENQTTSSDVLFTCTLPTRKHSMPLSASELSLTEARDKVPPLRRHDPGLMPLPDTASGLEWSSLVNAAKAFEAQRAVSLFSLNEPQLGGPEARPTASPVQFNTPQTPRTTPTFSGDEVPNDMSGRLYQLEVMLKQLNNDLEKEKQDKVVLLAEMANLRENNQRLQEESLTASEQLRKFNMAAILAWKQLQPS